MVKNLPARWETWVQSLGREDPLEKSKATPLQYSCLENPKDRGVWWATVHGVTKSGHDSATNTHTHITLIQLPTCLPYNVLIPRVR